MMQCRCFSVTAAVVAERSFVAINNTETL